MHDYQISWDYMEDDFIEKKNLIILNKIVKDIKKQLMPMQGFKNFSVHPIILPNNILGIYCSGTYSKPVIGVDIGNIIEASEEYRLNWVHSLRTTILHELKHACQEYDGVPLDEEEAENFAYMN